MAWRWRWLLLIVAAVSLAGSLVFALRPPRYRSELRVLLEPTLPPDRVLLTSRYPQQLLRIWYVERMQTDLGDYLESRAFASAVAARYGALFGEAIEADQIIGALEPEKVHRTLRIRVTMSSPEAAYRTAQAAAAELAANGAQFATDEAGRSQMEVAVITGGSLPQRVVPWLRLVVAGVMALGIVAALLLALRIVEGHRTTLDTAEEATIALGLPILGTVPPPAVRRRLMPMAQ